MTFGQLVRIVTSLNLSVFKCLLNCNLDMAKYVYWLFWKVM